MLGGAAAWENVDSTAGRAGPRGRAGLGLPCRPLTAFSRRVVPQVRAPPRLLHADPDALGRRAHDHLLQVLQPAVRAPLAGLRRRGQRGCGSCNKRGTEDKRAAAAWLLWARQGWEAGSGRELCPCWGSGESGELSCTQGRGDKGETRVQNTDTPAGNRETPPALRQLLCYGTEGKAEVKC